MRRPTANRFPPFATAVRAFTNVLALQARTGGTVAVFSTVWWCAPSPNRNVALGDGVDVPARIENTPVTRIEDEPPYRVTLPIAGVAHLAADEARRAAGIAGI